jgi:hypothetical protein
MRKGVQRWSGMLELFKQRIMSSKPLDPDKACVSVRNRKCKKCGHIVPHFRLASSPYRPGGRVVSETPDLKREYIPSPHLIEKKRHWEVCRG